MQSPLRITQTSNKQFAYLKILKSERVEYQVTMCIERLRCYNFCKAVPKHGYWQLDLCVEAIRRRGIPCDVREKEPPTSLPAPIGAEFCPYAGCSHDPKYQVQETGLTTKGRKGWGKAYYSVGSQGK